jgi:hypothetical protein
VFGPLARTTIFHFVKLSKPLPWVLLLAALPVQCRAPGISPRASAMPPYWELSLRSVGYGNPIVNESVVFYDNRYTDQNYHAIDTKRTADAFLRDFKYCLARQNLRWVQLADSLQTWVIPALAHGIIDSVPSRARSGLTRAGIEYVVMVYDVRLSLVQMVGSDAAEHLPGGRSTISRRLSFKCSILDVSSGEALYCKEFHRESSGFALDLLEKTIGAFLHDITRN